MIIIDIGLHLRCRLYGSIFADVVAPMSDDPKLIIRVINFELFEPICSRYHNVTDRQTDRQTDRLMDDLASTILRASRGKNSVDR